MSWGGRVQARAVGGSVLLEVDPATAEDLAVGLVSTEDFLTIALAAARARVQLGLVPAPVSVPVLRLVGDESPVPGDRGEAIPGAGHDAGRPA